MLTESIRKTKQMHQESYGNKEKRKRLWKGLVPLQAGDTESDGFLFACPFWASRQACSAAKHAVLGCALRADSELRVIKLLVRLKLNNQFVSCIYGFHRQTFL
jgi:hypothetical protein